MTLRFTVSDSPDLPGLYCWELSDRGVTESGFAPTISRCLTEIAAARLAIERHFAGHRDPWPSTPADSPPYLKPASFDTPNGSTLPAQQDIPAAHTPDSSTFFYPRPSNSG